MAPVASAWAARCAIVASCLIVPLEAAAQDALPPLPPAPAPAAPAPSPAPASAPPEVLEGPIPPAPPAVAEPVEAKPEAPPANTGFQLHAGLGYAGPFGKISNDDGDLADVTTGQLMLLDLGIGGKIGRFFYLGAYLALAGGSSRAINCDHCGSATGHLGIEAQYFFRPAAKWDPWIGYGLGFEATSADTQNGSLTYGGFEFARLTAGVDARISHGFGLGPYLGLSFARYGSRDLQRGNMEIRSDVQNPATHGWLTLGLRFVVFP